MESKLILSDGWIDGLELATRPDLTLAGRQTRNRRQRLHRGVREVRKFKLGIDGVRRAFERCIRVTFFRGLHRIRAPREKRTLPLIAEARNSRRLRHVRP